MIISETLRFSAPGAEPLPYLRPTLAALLQPIEAEGAAVIDCKNGRPILLCEVGQGSSTILNVPNNTASLSAPYHFIGLDGRPVLIGPCQTADGRKLVVAIWRKFGAEPWTKQDYRLLLMASAALGVLSPSVTRTVESAWRGHIDDLTGLPRARKLVEDLPRHCARLDRDGLPGTLIIASIDEFKKISETSGNSVADDLLRQVAKFLRESTRPTDMVARVGGNEFAIWFNGVDQFTGVERAERLKSDVHLVAVALQKPTLSVCLSIGIATRHSGSTETINSLMRRANSAMHEARQAGPGNWRMSQGTIG